MRCYICEISWWCFGVNKESCVCLVLRFRELVQGSVAPASAMTSLLVRTASNNP
jgi:hypothetical protein